MAPALPHVCVSIYMVWQEKLGCQILGFIVHTYQICNTAEILEYTQQYDPHYGR